MKYISRRRQTLSARSRAALALTVLGSGAVAALMPQAAHAQAVNGITFTSLYSFGSAGDGTNPYKALTLGANGNFYGVAYNGGANDDGSVFEITPAGVETTLYSFSGSDGKNPRSTLALSTDGNFYGTTENGGASDDGTIFQITPSGTLTTLYSFSGTDGKDPTSALVFDNAGNLYGTCDFGGTSGEGVIYELNTSFQLTVLHSFSGSDGQHPISGLTFGTDGNLYGTALNGPSSAGEIFQYTPGGALNVLYSFSGPDGMDPESTMVLGFDGNFYGETTAGGANGDGTIFKVTPTGSLTTLYSFSGAADGASPYGALLQSENGNFYGTTRYGGANDTGTVFQVTLAGKLATLYTFSVDPAGITDHTFGNNDGAYPFCPLVQGSGGTLYGTTNGGGTNNDGTVFKLTGAVGSGERFDYNGDGNADLLFYNNTTGGVSVWDMDDTTVLNYGGTFASVDPSSGWIPVTSPSATGDGYPDLMWWNKNTGELSIWDLQNTAVTQFGGDFATVSDTDWRPEAVGDDTNPTYNLVFQNTATGDISVWQMNNQSVVQFGGTMASLGPNSPWTVVGAPDLDGDGKSDLLFYNTNTGEVSYWSCDLSNDTVLAYHGDIAQVTDLNQHLIGAEDLNGDGYADLIWRNQNTGAISRWLMNGTTVEQYGAAFAQINDLDWRPDAIR